MSLFDVGPGETKFKKTATTKNHSNSKPINQTSPEEKNKTGSTQRH